MKTSGGKFIFLILYVDNILLASSDLNLLNDTKKFLSMNFDMKDIGEASFVLGIVVKRFEMHDCTVGDVPMVKGDKFNKALRMI